MKPLRRIGIWLLANLFPRLLIDAVVNADCFHGNCEWVWIAGEYRIGVDPFGTPTAVLARFYADGRIVVLAQKSYPQMIYRGAE